MARVTASVAPPGGKPTMKRMGFEGNAWDRTCDAKASEATSNAIPVRGFNMVSIPVLPDCDELMALI